MGRVERGREIARRRVRRAKLKKYRGLYAEAKTQEAKDEIAAKVRRISPLVNLEEAV